MHPASLRLATIKTRADFLSAARGIRRSQGSLTLEMAPTPGRGCSSDTVRYGVTASRKVGGAVERNRAKRRLREAARAVLPLSAIGGNDYVLVARRETLSKPFDDVLADLVRALEAAHARQRNASGDTA